MTPEELIAQLAAVRVPEGFASFAVQDALAACALGLIAALLVLALFQLVTVRRVRPVEQAMDAIRGLAQCDRQTRITGLAGLLEEHGGKAPEGLFAALYDPTASVDPIALENAVISAASRKRSR